MTVIYIDSLFLLNFVVDYLLLLCSARLAGETIHRLRLALGGLLGAGYAVLSLFPRLGALSHPLFKLAVGVLLVLCAFGGSRRLFRLTLIFFGVSAAFGGAILALRLLDGGGMSGGKAVLFAPLDLRVILLSAAVCYGLFTLVFRRIGRHSTVSGELKRAIVALDGKRVSLTTLVDTGNTLTDPVTNGPVMVAEGDKLFPLFPAGEAPSMEELRDPVAAMERLSHGALRRRLRLLPYQTVGVECGLLLCVQPDAAKVGETKYEKLLVALSPYRLSDGGGYSALIGP